MASSYIDVSGWFNNYVTTNNYVVKQDHVVHVVGMGLLFSCTMTVCTRDGRQVDTSKSDQFLDKKSATKHARFIIYTKYRENLMTTTSNLVTFDGPDNSSYIGDMLIPCNGEKCFNIIDVESVQRPSKVVQFNGPAVYFCRQQTKTALPITTYDEIDCLSTFDLYSDNNVCVVGADMSEIVDHYISACAVHILYYCKRSDIKRITISSVDLSAKCTVYIMNKLIDGYKMDIQVQLLGRSVYLKEKDR